MTIASKRVRVTSDGGSNYYTLPGNQASIQRDSATVDDTIFGQNFKSMQPTLVNAKISANAMYRGFAGYVATIKMSGTTTSMSGEAVTNVSGKIYQITNAAKRIIDRAITFNVLDGATNINAQVISIDYLNGIVTLDSGYTVVGTITVTGNYLPTTAVAKANNYTLTMQAAAQENSDYATMQSNSGHRTYQYGLQTVSLALKGFYDVANGFEALLDGRTEVIIELSPDGQGASGSMCRGFYKLSSDQSSGNVGAIEDYSLTFTLTVPDMPLMPAPFIWYHAAGTKLSQAVQKILNAWANGSTLGAQYLPDGTTGFAAASCIVTDCSLSGAVDGINTFAADLQISGTITAV